MPRLISEAAKAAKVAPSRAASGVDVVGDVAILRLLGLTLSARRRVGTSILKEVPNVRCVYNQEGGIEGEYRLRRLEHLAGEKRTLTVHRENGCSFKVDVATCYFSPRLSTERLRVARSVKRTERVLNMFAGVGPFSIPAAKLSGAKVTSCEVNPEACGYHLENNVKNKVDGLVRVLEADAMDLPKLTRSRFDRVLMPHPSESEKFLPTAVQMAKKGALIQYYRHVLGRDEAEASSALKAELKGLLPPGSKLSCRKVRAVGPRWLEMSAEVRLPD